MKSEKKPLVVILGPTAVGKSSLALALAERWKTEIVSVDAMQIYKYMDIGTAKPSVSERSLVPHHMIDIVYPDEDYNAGRYEWEACQAIHQIHCSEKIPLLVGGCGLYLKAVLYGFFQGPKVDLNLRNQLKDEMKKREDYLYEKLKQIDPQSAQKLHPNDHPKVIRALEVYLQTGIPMSVYQKDHSFKKARYQTRVIGLTRNRKDLYSRIEKRIDKMIEMGLIEEVEKLLELDYSENSTALQGLGYKQIIAALKGKYSMNEAIQILKRDTRHYAKRQFTWFRKVENVHWIDLTEQIPLEDVLNQIQNLSMDLFA